MSSLRTPLDLGGSGYGPVRNRNVKQPAAHTSVEVPPVEPSAADGDEVFGEGSAAAGTGLGAFLSALTALAIVAALAIAITGLVLQQTNTVKSINGQTGALTLSTLTVATGDTDRTLISKLDDWLSVLDYGAISNGGVGDNCGAFGVAAAAAGSLGKGLLIPGGIFGLGCTVNIPAGVAVMGQGIGNTILLALPTLPVTSPMLANPNQGAYTDTDISLQSLSIDGNFLELNSSQTRTTPFVSFKRVSGFTVTDVAFYNTPYTALACDACVDASVTASSFKYTGFLGQSSDGGSALRFARVGSDEPRLIGVSGCAFSLTNWTALEVDGSQVSISGNGFFNVSENAIVVSGSNVSLAEVISIAGNVIDSVYLHNATGTGISISYGSVVDLTGNVVRRTDGAAIHLINTDRATLTGNVLGDFNRLNNGTQCGLWVDSLGGVAANVSSQYIDILSNSFYDAQSTPTGYAPIQVVTASGSLTVSPLSILTNDFSGGAWRNGATTIIFTGGTGAQTYISKNVGCSQNQDFVTGRANFTSTLGTQSVTGLTFTPSGLQLACSAAPATNTTAWSNVFIPSSGLPNGLYSASDWQGATSGPTTGYALYVVNSQGTAYNAATFTAFTTTGFTCVRRAFLPSRALTPLPQPQRHDGDPPGQLHVHRYVARRPFFSFLLLTAPSQRGGEGSRRVRNCICQQKAEGESKKWCALFHSLETMSRSRRDLFVWWTQK